ncbi:putative transposase [Escherichia coli DEC13D]|nr:putative transposase [Escherichia coli DEC13D]
MAAGEQVVPASELAAAMKQIKELQRLLGKKTMENELLKEAVEYGRAKKWIEPPRESWRLNSLRKR